MSSCVIFGGSGFVGTHLAEHFLKTKRFDKIHLADIRPSPLAEQPGIIFSNTDVRQPIPTDLCKVKPDWIFNLAAVHREPGHIREEYFETNLAGARNVCAYADAVACDNIYFTSSISVYGPTTGPTDENFAIQPSTPYGGSKYPAELIHEMWQKTNPGRRLLTSRPGVLYGPGDPGNVMRMIQAISKGYFAFPGSPGIYKSYGYIYGFIDSIDFVMDHNKNYFVYNYVETPTEPLKELAKIIRRFIGAKAVVLPIPLWILKPISYLVQVLVGFRNPIHPVRVMKAATPTHIIPQALVNAGFEFKYDFESSLHHWLTVAPDDFDMITRKEKVPQSVRIILKKQGEHIDTSQHPRSPIKARRAVVELEEEAA